MKKRKSPTESAKKFVEGSIKKGNDKNLWVVKKTKNGIHRWTPYVSTHLFGFSPLTVDYISKNIGKTIIIYEREYCDKWPTIKDIKSNFCKLYKRYFIPTGDAIIIKGKKILLKNWLKKQNPSIPGRSIFILDGRLYGNDLEEEGLQVDSKNKIFVSSNIMNTEAFIQINK